MGAASVPAFLVLMNFDNMALNSLLQNISALKTCIAELNWTNSPNTCQSHFGVNLSVSLPTWKKNK